MLLNRKYINDLTEELERAQETNKDCLKIIEFWRERSNKLKEDIEVKEDTIENLLDANKRVKPSKYLLRKTKYIICKGKCNVGKRITRVKN